MFRVFVKKMLCYVPVVGWSWLMSDVVFLARDWDKDRLKLAEGVQKVNKNIIQYLMGTPSSSIRVSHSNCLKEN